MLHIQQFYGTLNITIKYSYTSDLLAFDRITFVRYRRVRQ